MGILNTKSAMLSAQKMKNYTTKMLQIAFDEAFKSLYGEQWYKGFKDYSEKYANEHKKPHYNIAANYSSVNKMDFQAFMKTFEYFDNYREDLVRFYDIKNYNYRIKDIGRKLKNYRNSNTDAHDSGENEKKIKEHEFAMEEMKSLAGFFSEIVNPETGNTFKKDIERIYSEYIDERDKKFYYVDEVFDSSQYTIEDFSFAVTIVKLKTDWKSGKLGFYSTDLDKDKEEILKTIAVKNLGKGREEKPDVNPKPETKPEQPKNAPSAVPPVTPQPKPRPNIPPQGYVPPRANPAPQRVTPPAANAAFREKKEIDPEKKQKIITAVLAAIIAILAIVLAARVASLVKNRAAANTTTAAASTTVSTTVSTTAATTTAAPTTAATTQSTTTTTTTKTTTKKKGKNEIPEKYKTDLKRFKIQEKDYWDIVELTVGKSWFPKKSELVWEISEMYSEDTSVVIVEDGIFKAVGEGTTNVLLISTEGSTKFYEITVS